MLPMGRRDGSNCMKTCLSYKNFPTALALHSSCCRLCAQSKGSRAHLASVFTVLGSRQIQPAIDEPRK